MWLLNTRTLRLDQFFGPPPSYAILSHWWEEDQEVAFGDITAASARLKGGQKILEFCRTAREDGFEYGWADTCCIDQKSSAELSEAINSMYAWYGKASVCYAYLADVNDQEGLAQSSWFTRGWTLQELLAPKNVVLYNTIWNVLGTRASLAPLLQRITGIPRDALLELKSHRFCVAEKMSWAAKRKTTREEDRAYSLLGLFNFNMPMLYGEGDRAFQRLQEEIMKTSTDASLFLWQGQGSENFGALARGPSCFADVHDVVTDWGHYKFDISQGWTVKNVGITMEDAILKPFCMTARREAIYMLQLGKTAGGDAVGIFLQSYNDAINSQEDYYRVEVKGRTLVASSTASKSIFEKARTIQIRRRPLGLRLPAAAQGVSLRLRLWTEANCSAYCNPNPSLIGFSQMQRNLLRDWPCIAIDSQTDEHCSISFPLGETRDLLGCVVINDSAALPLLICVGMDERFRVSVFVLPSIGDAYQNGMTEAGLYHHCKRLIQKIPPDRPYETVMVSDKYSTIFAVFLAVLSAAPTTAQWSSLDLKVQFQYDPLERGFDVALDLHGKCHFDVDLYN